MTKSWRRYEQTPSLPGPSCRNAADGACLEGRLRIIGWHGCGAIVAGCIVGIVFSCDGWRQSQDMSDVARNVEL